MFALSKDQYVEYHTSVESLLKTSLLISQLSDNKITIDTLCKEKIYPKIFKSRPKDNFEATIKMVVFFNKTIFSLPYSMLTEYAGDNFPLIGLNVFAHEIFSNMNNLSCHKDQLAQVVKEIASKDMLTCLMKVRLQLNIFANTKLYIFYIKPKDIEQILKTTNLEQTVKDIDNSTSTRDKVYLREQMLCTQVKCILSETDIKFSNQAEEENFIDVLTDEKHLDQIKQFVGSGPQTAASKLNTKLQDVLRGNKLSKLHNVLRSSIDFQSSNTYIDLLEWAFKDLEEARLNQSKVRSLDKLSDHIKSISFTLPEIQKFKYSLYNKDKFI